MPCVQSEYIGPTSNQRIKVSLTQSHQMELPPKIIICTLTLQNARYRQGSTVFDYYTNVTGSHMQCILQVLFFFFSGNLYLEVFNHQIHTERNTFARLDSSNGNATSFAFLHTALEIQDLWQQKTVRQKRTSLKLQSFLHGLTFHKQEKKT